MGLTELTPCDGSVTAAPLRGEVGGDRRFRHGGQARGDRLPGGVGGAAEASTHSRTRAGSLRLGQDLTVCPSSPQPKHFITDVVAKIFFIV